MDPGNWPRLWKLGGVAFPGHSKATDYVKEYRQYRPKQTPYLFGWGYGADLGGLSHQPGRRHGASATRSSPTTARSRFERQKTGERTFDYTKEGVAHYGLYADWFEDLRRLGGGGMAARHVGRRGGLPPDVGARRGHPRRRLPPSARARARRAASGGCILAATGRGCCSAPASRSSATGRGAGACAGRRNRTKADFAELTTTGKVELAGSTARGRHAGRIFVGSRAPRCAGLQPIGRGLYVRRAGRRSRFVYYVRKGRVRMVAVATRKLASSRRRLRAAVRRALRARAANVRRTFVPASTASASLRGSNLAGSSNQRLNRQLALLCGLGN